MSFKFIREIYVEHHFVVFSTFAFLYFPTVVAKITSSLQWNCTSRTTPLHCRFLPLHQESINCTFKFISCIAFRILHFAFHFVLLYQLLQLWCAFIAIFFRKSLDERVQNSLNEFSRILFNGNKGASAFYCKSVTE